MLSWKRRSGVRVFHLLFVLIVPHALWPDLAVSQEFPPEEASAVGHLDASPRHGEWVGFLFT